MTYTGDVLLKYDSSTGEVDIAYKDGQPEMTDGLESCVILAVFGESNCQNGMTRNTSEKYESTFPQVVDRATVNETTKNNGTKAIEKALAFMVTEKIASNVVVNGYILSAYSIGWTIDIYAPTGTTRYAINWEKGSLTMGYVA